MPCYFFSLNIKKDPGFIQSQRGLQKSLWTGLWQEVPRAAQVGTVHQEQWPRSALTALGRHAGRSPAAFFLPFLIILFRLLLSE